MISNVFTLSLNRDVLPAGKSLESGIRDEWLLSDFVGDDENFLLRQIAEKLPESLHQYNPLVLHGPSGVGKTLFCRFVAAASCEANNDLQVELIYGNDFVRQHRLAADSNNLDEFRKQLRQSNLLILDNLDDLKKKDAAQLELSRLLDELCNAGHQVIVTTRQPIGQRNWISPRLAGRLANGLQISVEPPGRMARVEITRRLTSKHNVDASEETILDLAQRKSASENKRITAPLLNHVIVQLKNFGNDENSSSEKTAQTSIQNGDSKRKLSLHIISSMVTKYLKLRLTDVRGASRRSQLVRARGIAIYLGRIHLGLSFGKIGAYFNGRDHTTVLHAFRTMEKLLQHDAEVKTSVCELDARLTDWAADQKVAG